MKVTHGFVSESKWDKNLDEIPEHMHGQPVVYDVYEEDDYKFYHELHTNTIGWKKEILGKEYGDFVTFSTPPTKEGIAEAIAVLYDQARRTEAAVIEENK